MLSLNPGCICDVCAEEYGPRNLPHTITCGQWNNAEVIPPSLNLTLPLFPGHILCLGCCEKIISKTSPRLSPACPFCREHFTRENVRVIRIDFGTSGHSTPKRGILDAPDIVTDIFSRKDDLKLAEPLITSRSREDVRRLELKVARVAAQKSSVEEVSMLYQELQAWLAAEPKGETQVCLRVAHQLLCRLIHVFLVSQNTALQLSAALLRAILVNHVSHSEANKQSRSMELSMKERLDEMEASHNKLEAELRG